MKHWKEKYKINIRRYNHSEYMRKWREKHPEYRDYMKHWKEKYKINIRLYNKSYQLGWCKRNREAWDAILIANGYISCTLCGYDLCRAALDFHHIDPKNKIFNIGNWRSRKPTPERITEVLKEAKKCMFICANCHRELETIE